MSRSAREAADSVAPLAPAPSAALSVDGLPMFGGFEGIVASAALTPIDPADRLGGSDPVSALNRRLREKSWVYVFAATSELALAAVVVDGAITGTGFLMVTDLSTGEVLVDSSRKLARASVNDAPGEGLRATYRLPGTSYRIERDDDDLHLLVSLGRAVVSLPGRSEAWVDVDLVLREEGTGITAISQVEHGGGSSVAVTAKTAGMPVTGHVVVRAADGSTRELGLDGGFGGYDYTKGLLPRHTAWRWAYATGRLADGTVLGLNLVEGFSGIGERARENVVWIDGRPVAVDARTRFAFDRDDVLQPWTITTQDGSVRLRFYPVAAHDERFDVRILRSLFIQPVGHLSGEIDVDGRTYVIDRLPGVVEDQDILW